MSNNIIEPVSSHDKPNTRAVTVKDLVRLHGLSDDVIEALRTPEPDFEMKLTNDAHINIGSGSGEFSRASSATYIAKNGVLKTAGIDEPRFEKEGMLIEGVSTNIVPTHIPDPNDTGGCYYWSRGRNTVETVQGINPFGVNGDISKVTSKNNEAFYVRLREPTVLKARACSLFIKEATAPIRLIGITETGYSTNWVVFNPTTLAFEQSSGDIKYGAEKLSNGWIRLWGYDPLAVDALAYEFQTNRECYIYGGQLEDLSFASSYIPTNGAAATRASDVLRVPNFSLTKDMTLAATLDFGETKYGRWFEGRFGGVLFNTRRTGTAWMVTLGSELVSTGTPSTTEFPHVLSVSGNRFIMYNGKQVADKTLTGTLPTTPSYLYIGCENQTGNQSVYGHIKNLRVWNQVLTPNQVALIK